jgi:hypothetical protein
MLVESICLFVIHITLAKRLGLRMSFSFGCCDHNFSCKLPNEKVTEILAVSPFRLENGIVLEMGMLLMLGTI